jgi:hypothetical protein
MNLTNLLKNQPISICNLNYRNIIYLAFSRHTLKPCLARTLFLGIPTQHKRQLFPQAFVWVLLNFFYYNIMFTRKMNIKYAKINEKINHSHSVFFLKEAFIYMNKCPNRMCAKFINYRLDILRNNGSRDNGR